MIEILHKTVVDLGRFGIFVYDSIESMFHKPNRFRLFMDEMEFIGNQSIFIVCLTSIFSGAVLAYQTWLGFDMVGTSSLVGVSVSLSLVRELAPIMAGIVVAGRAGGAMAAKIGIMRVTEQIDALEIMAISPLQYLVGPRILASTIALPILVALFGLVGNVGGYFVATAVCGIDSGIYIQKLKLFMDPWDFYHGMIKASIFGFLLAAISCYQGYKAEGGVEGVGKATNNAVVFSTVTILVLDYFLGVLVPTGIRTQGQ